MKRIFMLLILVNALIVGRMLCFNADSYAGDIDYSKSEGSSTGYIIPRSVAIEELERAREERLQFYRANIEDTTEAYQQESAIADNDSFTAEAIGNDAVAGVEGAGGDDVSGDVVTGLPTAAPKKHTDISER